MGFNSAGPNAKVFERITAVGPSGRRWAFLQVLGNGCSRLAVRPVFYRSNPGLFTHPESQSSQKACGSGVTDR